MDQTDHRRRGIVKISPPAMTAQHKIGTLQVFRFSQVRDQNNFQVQPTKRLSLSWWLRDGPQIFGFSLQMIGNCPQFLIIGSRI